MSTLTKQLEGSVALERVKSGELEAPTPNAMQLIQSAIAQGSSIDTIERLAALQREMVEYQAKVEFNEAMQRVQHKMRRISADAHNPQTKSRYASYAKLDSVLRPIYAEEGFSLSFNTGDSPVLNAYGFSAMFHAVATQSTIRSTCQRMARALRVATS